MNNLTIGQLDSTLKEQLKDEVVALQTRIERTLLRPVPPNAESSFRLKKIRSLRDLKLLCIASWYLGPYGDLLRLDIREHKVFQHQQLAEKERLEVLLVSKETMLSYIWFLWSERKLFGTEIPQMKTIIKFLQFLSPEPHRPKRTIRRRGYQDKGSCRSQSRWLPNSDFTFDLEQNLIEQEREFRSLVFTSIQSFGLLGVRLSELEGRV